MDQTCLDKQSKGNAGSRVEKQRQGWAWCGRQGIARALSRYAPLCYAAQRHRWATHGNGIDKPG
nr:MAG TPA: hypothetical protein [Bacteriophage sp.]